MSSASPTSDLARRERQIMDVVYRRGEATVAEVLAELPDPPSYSAVRAMLRKLQEKGHLTHRQDGPRYLYSPTVPRDEAQEGAMRRLVRTFFGGSPARAAAALLDMESTRLSDRELDELAELIEHARKGGR
ncbi:MAG TPA: BlaI/MecI/CopY family transcriptional regulator [Longimicrobiaceae bacterium]|nr:BlaI/MecI/CopY family transcriptional regulator [Longimicrobiaceae bacterium]